jgi:hypothetical protein
MPTSYNHSGLSVCSIKASGGTAGSPVSITTAYQAYPVTIDRANSCTSAAIPNDCEIQVIEFELTARTSATSITMYLARDSAGDIPITNPSEETITNGMTTTAKGGVAFSSLVDYHFDSGTRDDSVDPATETGIANTSSGTLYVIAKQTGGSAAVGNIRIYWRS